MNSNINRALSVAVISGKGGVGKTNIALNVAFNLFRNGHKLLLMDCDLGLANMDVLLGIAPENNIQDVLDRDVAPASITVPLELGGLDFLPAASGVPEMVNMDEEMRLVLLNKLRPLFVPYEFIMLDMGAGITPVILSFAAMSRVRLVIITPEPTSLTDGYALIKVLNKQYGLTDFHIVVNMAETEREKIQSYERLAAACKHFLGFSPAFLGAVSADKAVLEAVRTQTPLVKSAPQSKAARDMAALAVKLEDIRREQLDVLSREEPFAVPAELIGAGPAVS